MRLDIKERHISYINSLKGIAIISVVIGHSGSPIGKYIYMYHMALFFFISGYFYKENYTDDPIRLIGKRIKSLYLPFVFYEVLFILLRNFFISINVYDINNVAKINNINEYIDVFKKVLTFNTSGDLMLGAIWFIITLFYVNILFLIIKLILKRLRVTDEKFVFFIIFTIYIVGFFLLKEKIDIKTYINPNNRKIINFILKVFDSRNMIIVLIYYLGNLYKKYEDRIILNKYMVLAFLVILIYNGKYVLSIDVAFNKLRDPLYFLVNSMLGIYVNIYFAKIKRISDNKCLQYIGQESMFIMIFHLLAFKLVNLLQVIIYNQSYNMIARYPTFMWKNGWWVLYSIIGVVIPIIIKLIINRIILIGKYFINLTTIKVQ